jgi:PIN domain nuclease of toxin-antitoxin system
VTTVLDASALLAFLHDEPGSDLVEAALENESCCGAANWSEVAQQVGAAARDWDLRQIR